MLRGAHLLALALVGPLLGACNDACLQSAAIQVNVWPDPTVDPSRIAKLHVALSVNGGQAKSIAITPPQPIDRAGSAFLLVPDTTPARPMYNLTVTIEAVNAAGTLIGIGSDSEPVAAKGCNRLNVHLTGLDLQSPLDMSVASGDGSGTHSSDLAATSDLAGCIGGMPDEDNDGRANFCDLCPADYDPTPTDSDGDGLPDACDPDPMKPVNHTLYFDPFDSDTRHWSGRFTVAMSALQIDPNPSPNNPTFNVPQNISNAVDTLPLNVRVQAFAIASSAYVQSQQPAFATLAVFLGDGPDPQVSGTNGVVCQLRLDAQNGDAVRIRAVVNGSLGSFNQTFISATSCGGSTVPPPQQFCFNTNTRYRIRLTQRDSTYTCEVLDDAGNSYSPEPLTATPPAGPTQTIVLEDTNFIMQFNSVVAESALLP
jgi:hypothetical protein